MVWFCHWKRLISWIGETQTLLSLQVGISGSPVRSSYYCCCCHYLLFTEHIHRQNSLEEYTIKGAVHAETGENWQLTRDCKICEWWHCVYGSCMQYWCIVCCWLSVTVVLLFSHRVKDILDHFSSLSLQFIASSSLYLTSFVNWSIYMLIYSA